MTEIIIIFGALILIASIVILIRPEIVFGFLRTKLDRPKLHVLAVAVRLVLGILLIDQSNASRYPFVIEIIGWLLMVTAVFLGVMGRHNFKRLMSWALSLVGTYGRVAGFLATAFGSFLVYAFI
ncbi:MAG: hypothetical protein V3S15_06445 [Woeseiaceae bacterium]